MKMNNIKTTLFRIVSCIFFLFSINLISYFLVLVSTSLRFRKLSFSKYR